MNKTIEVTTFWEYYPDDNTFPQLLGGWDEILIDENETGFEEEKAKLRDEVHARGGIFQIVEFDLPIENLERKFGDQIRNII